MTGAAADTILLAVAGARLEQALDQGDAETVMEAAAELSRLSRRLGAAASDDASLRPALRASAAQVARVLARLAEAQEAALAAQIHQRRVHAAYGVRL